MRRYRLPTIRLAHVWAIVVMAGVLLFLETHPLRPQDFWWHLRMGEALLATRALPTVDTLTHTRAGAPYTFGIFWLPQIAYALTFCLGGVTAILLLHTLVVGAGYALLLWSAYRVSGSWRAAALGLFFAAALGFNDWNVRPQGLAFLAAGLILAGSALYRSSARARWLALWPLGMLLWVNGHGSFPIGLVLVGLGWLDALRVTRRAWMELSGAAVLAVLACLLNPQGLGAIRYALGMTSNPLIQHLIPEWAPPGWGTFDGALFLGGLLLSGALLMLAPQRPRLAQVAAWCGLGALALRTSRGIVWFAMALAPVLAETLSTWEKALGWVEPPLTPLTRRVNQLLAGLALVAIIAGLPPFKVLWPLAPEKRGLLSPETPVAATEALLRLAPPGPLFNAMDFGSYLEWAAPTYPVFVDTRIELFTLAIWQDYLSISQALPGWEARLAAYGVRTALLNQRTQAPLIAALAASPDWCLLYADATAVLFTRGPCSPATGD